jgi:glutaredoxin
MNFQEPDMDNFTIYSKSGCLNCNKVKTLLKGKSLVHIIIDCDEYLLEDKEGFLDFIKEKASIECKIFPMVFYKGKFIGGFSETQTHIEKMLSFDENIYF